MRLNPKIHLATLIVLNGMVLLGQVWPEGAPPFARAVNVLFLALSLAYFIAAFRRAAFRRLPGGQK